jgi:mannosyltransferase
LAGSTLTGITTASLKPRPWRARRRTQAVVLGLMLADFLLGLNHLGSKSLWLDEAVAISHATSGLHHLWLTVSGQDPNMGLYYVLLDGWIRAVGTGAGAVRLLSVLAATATVPLVVALGARLFGELAGLLAGLLFVLNAFLLQYAQTARGYTLVAGLVVASCYCFVVELEQPSRASAVGLVVTSALAIYAHYFAAFVLLVEVGTVLALKRREALTRRWLVIAAAVLVACVPEARAASAAGTTGISWIPTPSAAAPVNFLSTLSGGVLLAIGLGGLACYAGFLALRNAPGTADTRWQTGFVAALLLVPILVSFALSFITPIFYPRYLIVTLPALVLIAAAGLVRLPSRGLAAAVALAIAGLSAHALADWYAQPPREDNRGVAKYLVQHTQPGDGYITFPRYAATPLLYYFARISARGPERVTIGALREGVVKPRRIWLVLREFDVHRELNLARSVERGISLHYTQVSARRFSGLQMVLYVKRR